MWDALLAFDREHVWHPTAPMPAAQRAAAGRVGAGRAAAAGRRARADRRDGVVVVRDPRLPPPGARRGGRATSSSRMAHVMFGGLTHEPAVRARRAAGRADARRARARLLRRLRLGLGRGRDQDGAAVPARARAPAKHRLLTLRGGYHGDTFGAMAVCDPVGGMHSLFAGRAPRQRLRAAPAGRLRRDRRRRWAAEVDGARSSAHADELAAVDRRAGRAGRGRHALLRARRACGCCASCATSTACCWSSTRSRPASAAPATLFASEHAGVAPDVMCVGKALTGGYLTLAATLCTARRRPRRSPAATPARSCTARRSWPTRSPARSRSPPRAAATSATGSDRRRAGSRPACAPASRRRRDLAGRRRRARPRRDRRRRSSTTPVDVAGGHRAAASSAASGCARSATSSTRCRRTSAPTRTSRRSAPQRPPRRPRRPEPFGP